MTLQLALMLSLVAPLAACGGSKSCPTGSQGCSCTAGGACDPGLSCGSGGFCTGTVSDGTKKHVFVTSTGYTGDLGGHAGADQLCTAAATASSRGGTWVAWISATPESAISHVKDASPWYLTDEKTVAFGSVAQLRTQPSVVIDHDENGVAVNVQTMFVWTGTASGGGASPNNCGDFTRSDEYGDGGTLDSTGNWTSGFSDRNCSEMQRLYCFEQ